jgi:WW domain-containing oxidoreductase
MHGMVRVALALLASYAIFAFAFRYALDPVPIFGAGSRSKSWQDVVTRNSHAGKLALVTGGNIGGIGFETVRALTVAGMEVVFSSRSQQRADQAAAVLGPQTHPLVLDLSNFASIRTFVDKTASILGGRKLHVLVLNGAYQAAASPFSKSVHGFELTFATNVLGNFGLVHILRERDLLDPACRVVVVSSHLHDVMATSRAKLTLRDFHWTRETFVSKLPVLGAMEIYANTKAADVLFVRELARQARLQTFAVHPGLIATNLGGERPDYSLPAWKLVPQIASSQAAFWFLMTLPATKTLAQGAATQVWAALAPELNGHTGLYYRDLQQVEPSRAAQDDELAKELWDMCTVLQDAFVR